MPTINKNYNGKNSLLENIGLLIFDKTDFLGEQLRYDFGYYYNLNLNNISFVVFPTTSVTFYNDNLDVKSRMLVNIETKEDKFIFVNGYINNNCKDSTSGDKCNITRIEVKKTETPIANKETRNKILQNLGAVYFPNESLRGDKILLDLGKQSLNNSLNFS